MAKKPIIKRPPPTIPKAIAIRDISVEDDDCTQGVVSTFKANASKKIMGLEPITNPLLVSEEPDCPDPYILILADRMYHENQLGKIMKLLRSIKVYNYRMIMPIPFHFIKDDLKGDGITAFYRENQSDWSEHLVNKWGVRAKAVVTIGQALYTLNSDTRKGVQDFYDLILNPTYFYSRKTSCYVFPVDSFETIYEDVPWDVLEKTKRPLDAPINAHPTFFFKHQFRSILTKTLPAPDDTPPIIIKIRSRDEFIELCRTAKDKYDLVAWDLETSGLDFMQDKVGCLTMSFDGVTGYYVPVNHIDIPAFNDLLGNISQLGANLKFDVKFMWKMGVHAARVDEDTFHLGHCLNVERSNSLKSHAHIYTTHGGYDQTLDDYKKKAHITNYLDIPEDVLVEYATLDAVLTFRVFQRMQNQLDWVDRTHINEKHPENTLRYYYESIVMPSVREFCRIEYKGIPIDRGVLAESREWLLGEIETTSKTLSEIWNCTSKDLQSPAKLGKLFEKMGFQDLGRGKDGLYKTSNDELTRWEQKGYKGIKELQYLRTLSIILKTFISSETNEEDSEKGWEQYIRLHPETNQWRIHPNYGVMSTSTGRSRSSNPNLQNVPAHGKLAALVKKAIAPESEEFVLSTADFVSLQICLAAMDTNYNRSGRDESLYDVYLNPDMGKDLHSLTGFKLWCEGISRPYDFIKIQLEDGTTHEYFAKEFVKITRNGESRAVRAEEIIDGDDIVGK